MSLYSYHYFKAKAEAPRVEMWCEDCQEVVEAIVFGGDITCPENQWHEVTEVRKCECGAPKGNGELCPDCSGYIRQKWDALLQDITDNLHIGRTAAAEFIEFELL